MTSVSERLRAHVTACLEAAEAMPAGSDAKYDLVCEARFALLRARELEGKETA